MTTAENYIKAVTQWARDNDMVAALGLIGSHARNEARLDSDIDFIIISDDKTALVGEHSWVGKFGKTRKIEVERWGIVTSLRIFYDGGQEIEFGVAPPSWAYLPVDAGTRRIVSEGMKILVDKQVLLSRLHKAVMGK